MTNKTNIIYYSLIKYKQITCSILLNKFYEIVYKFDIKIVIKAMLGKIIGFAIPLILYIN